MLGDTPFDIMDESYVVLREKTIHAVVLLSIKGVSSMLQNSKTSSATIASALQAYFN